MNLYQGNSQISNGAEDIMDKAILINSLHLQSNSKVGVDMRPPLHRHDSVAIGSFELHSN